MLKPPANERLQVLIQNESFSIAKSTNLGEYVDDFFGFLKRNPSHCWHDFMPVGDLAPEDRTVLVITGCERREVGRYGRRDGFWHFFLIQNYPRKVCDDEKVTIVSNRSNKMPHFLAFKRKIRLLVLLLCLSHVSDQPTRVSRNSLINCW